MVRNAAGWGLRARFAPQNVGAEAPRRAALLAKSEVSKQNSRVTSAYGLKVGLRPKAAGARPT